MSYDQDAPEWRQISDTKQHARQWYECEACPHGGPCGSAMIPPGQLYRRVSGVLDGEFQVHRECVGGCPNAQPCETCNGTGGWDQHQPCAKCDGTGKVRGNPAEATP